MWIFFKKKYWIRNSILCSNRKRQSLTSTVWVFLVWQCQSILVCYARWQHFQCTPTLHYLLAKLMFHIESKWISRINTFINKRRVVWLEKEYTANKFCGLRRTNQEIDYAFPLKLNYSFCFEIHMFLSKYFCN